jgi:hypothetical protein
MISRHQNGRPTSTSMGRSLRLATVLAAVVALTPPAIAGARIPSRIDDGSGAAASAQRSTSKARARSVRAVALDHAQCPCNAGLPVGTSLAYASAGRPQFQALNSEAR